MYGLATGLRNYLYDKSLLQSWRPDKPVILVGNMIAGGTGKTPVIAWLAAELSKKYKVAILSRGYVRRTSGFRLVDDEATPETAGDEPMELRYLLPDITIAVDGNRKRGITSLLSGRYGRIDVILMDDGFQHRRVTPGFSIVLDDFNRPMRKEPLLPAGLRREPLSGLKRASMVVVTKKEPVIVPEPAAGPVLLVTGIANAGHLAAAVMGAHAFSRHIGFRDHHRYTSDDAAEIRQAYLAMNARIGEAGDTPVILTTGKDYVKLIRMPELSGLPMKVIPANAPMSAAQKKEILDKIYQYVEEAYRNS